jgi:magnesium transporter
VRDKNALEDRPLVELVERDVPRLGENLTVAEALADIRSRGFGERIVYFYVVDVAGRLVGVVPTRRLLTAELGERIGDLMVRAVTTLSAEATVFEACEVFATTRFLALPVVDAERRLVGTVDVSVFTDKVFDLAERREVEDLFETIGFRVSQVRRASSWRAFQLRFPWLLATVAGGTSCALIASAFQATLAEAVVLALFLTLVLGLAESVCVQTLAVTVQSLHHDPPSWRWFARSLRHEVVTASLLAVSCGGVVGGVAAAWRGSAVEAVAVGGSIALVLILAACAGLVVPALIHALRLDPRVAAGPLALAVTDVGTVTIYLSIGAWLLAG